jgi:hypothetical protein
LPDKDAGLIHTERRLHPREVKPPFLFLHVDLGFLA